MVFETQCMYVCVYVRINVRPQILLQMAIVAWRPYRQILQTVGVHNIFPSTLCGCQQYVSP